MKSPYSCQSGVPLLSPSLLVGVVLVLLATTTSASPSILIPGDGASALEIQYKNMSLPHWWCSESSKNEGKEWERLWIPSLTELLPRTIDCWSTKMKLHYNETHVTNAPGVLGIRPIQGPKGLKIFANKDSPYQALVDALPDLKIATYDFRLSPRGNPSFLEELKEMVEQSSKDSSSKVNLISHSLGGLLVHHFLTLHVTNNWKQRYIQSWIPMAPAYGGTIYTLKQLVSGDDVNIPWLKGKDVKDQQRSYETSVWLLPDPNLYNGVVVSTPSKNYTTNDYRELFKDARFETFPTELDRVKNLTMWDSNKQLEDPKVKVYPVYGTNVDTVEHYIYSSDDMNEDPTQITSPNGDGTINLKSLKAGNEWSQAQAPLELKDVSHAGMLSDARVVHYIQNLVQDEGAGGEVKPVVA